MKAAAQKYRRLDKPIQQASLEEVSARLGAVMETIQKRKKQHARDMRSLYEWHATVYRDEMEDMRRCKDEYSPHATKVGLPFEPELCCCCCLLSVRLTQETGRLYAHSRLPRVNPTVRSFNSVVAQHRWAYLKSMIPLQHEVKDLEEARIRKEEARVADEQRRRNELERQRLMKEKAFPTSIDDYHAKSPAVQKLVREYLTETYPLRRTRMIQQHMWDKEAAEKMLGVMQTNVSTKLGRWDDKLTTCYSQLLQQSSRRRSYKTSMRHLPTLRGIRGLRVDRIEGFLSSTRRILHVCFFCFYLAQAMSVCCFPGPAWNDETSAWVSIGLMV